MVYVSGGGVVPTDYQVNSEDLRMAMRRWTTGVTIVTSAYHGVQHGMTVSSFTSVSLVPPLVLVSIERSTRTNDLIRKSGGFAVTILAQDQEEISNRFAGRDTELIDRFDGLPLFSLLSDAPLLEGGLAGFDCRVVDSYEAGNHTIFIGEVLASYVSSRDISPLLYYDRDYRQMCDQ